MDKIISVKVIAGVKIENVEEISPDVFKIRVSTPPEKGKANDRVVELLSKYLHIPKSKIYLKSGATNKQKKFVVNL